jgi:hypothetical protein
VFDKIIFLNLTKNHLSSTLVNGNFRQHGGFLKSSRGRIRKYLSKLNFIEYPYNAKILGVIFLYRLAKNIVNPAVNTPLKMW